MSSLFQFPLLLPVSYIWVALFFSYFLSKVYKKSVEISVTPLLRSFLLPISLFILSFSIILACANYHEFRSPRRYIEMYLSCHLSPANFRSCIGLSNIYIRYGSLKQAKSLLESKSEKDRYNFYYINEWARIESLLGNVSKECELLSRYVNIFNGRQKYLLF